MLDIVAAHDHQLPLPVDFEGINDAEPLLARAPARQLDATPENHTEQDKDQRHADQEAYSRQDEGEGAILSKGSHERHVLGSLGSAGNASNYHGGQCAGPKG